MTYYVGWMANLPRIRWFWNASETNFLYDTHYDDVSIVNPLYYPQLDLERGGRGAKEVYYYVSEIESDWLIIKTDQMYLVDKRGAEEDVGASGYAHILMKPLQHLTKQLFLTDFGRRSMLPAWDFEFDNPRPPAPLEDLKKIKKTDRANVRTTGKISKKSLDDVLEGAATAINESTLARLAQLSTDWEQPDHESVMIDACEAYRLYEYRKAVLFAAIAMEIGVSYAFRQEIERRKSQSKKGCLEENPKEFENLYELLEWKSRFNEKLDNVAYYVLGKTLKTDDQDLYRRAYELYKTRNKLVHQGHSSLKEQHHIDIECGTEVSKSLETVNEVLNWVGLEEAYPTGHQFSKDWFVSNVWEPLRS